jgi:hypothetical protein
MASTISAATLTVTLTESISLNGSEQGATNTKTFASINEISKRILTITTTECLIAAFGSTVAQGTFIIGNVKYMRFTNKDDTNFITLTFLNENNDEVAIKLDAGQSFIWNGDNAGGMVDVFNATQAADAASDTALGDLANIQADANTGSCDLEMIVASV